MLLVKVGGEGAGILLNFTHANKASKANFHENKRIIYWPLFMTEVYGHSLNADTLFLWTVCLVPPHTFTLKLTRLIYTFSGPNYNTLMKM